jgi:hypothetical protein
MAGLGFDASTMADIMTLKSSYFSRSPPPTPWKSSEKRARELEGEFSWWLSWYEMRTHYIRDAFFL